MRSVVRFHLAPRTSPADHEAPGAKDRATFDRYACQRPNGRIASRTSGAPITVLNSSVVGNSASCASGGISIGSSLTVRNSTISGNSTDAEGGGIFQSAGPDATFTMVNSTVTGNDTSSDNAGGGIQFFGAATIVYSMIVNKPRPTRPISAATRAIPASPPWHRTAVPQKRVSLSPAVRSSTRSRPGRVRTTAQRASPRISGSYRGRPRTVVTSAPSRFSPHRRVRARVRFRVRSVGRPERPERP